MANSDSNFKSMALVLLSITLVASALLGLVFQFTEAPIAKAKKDKINNAIRAVVPDFDNQPAENMAEKEYDGEKFTFYTATKNGATVGTAISTSSKKGFGGTIELMVGFLPNGEIHNIVTVSHKETPGLGAKIVDPSFKVQFEGKDPSNFKLSVKKDGGDVDAITASTISSRAYCDAVQRAYNALMEGGKK